LPILLIFLSIPAQPGPAAKLLRLPHFHGEKIRAERDYSQVAKITQVKMRKNQGKMKIFSGDCGFSGQKQQFFWLLPALLRSFHDLARQKTRSKRALFTKFDA